MANEFTYEIGLLVSKRRPFKIIKNRKNNLKQFCLQHTETTSKDSFYLYRPMISTIMQLTH